MAALVDSQMQHTQFSTSGVLSSLAIPPSNNLPTSLQYIPASIGIQQGTIASNAITVQDLDSTLGTPSVVTVGKGSSGSSHISAGVGFPPQSFQLQHQQDLNSVLQQQQPHLAEGYTLSVSHPLLASLYILPLPPPLRSERYCIRRCECRSTELEVQLPDR